MTLYEGVVRGLWSGVISLACGAVLLTIVHMELQNEKIEAWENLWNSSLEEEPAAPAAPAANNQSIYQYLSCLPDSGLVPDREYHWADHVDLLLKCQDI
jgi:hypothetical protein